MKDQAELLYDAILKCDPSFTNAFTPEEAERVWNESDKVVVSKKVD